MRTSEEVKQFWQYALQSKENCKLIASEQQLNLNKTTNIPHTQPFHCIEADNTN